MGEEEVKEQEIWLEDLEVPEEESDEVVGGARTKQTSPLST